MTAFDPETLSLLVDRTVQKTKREYAIVEKDYWVVWILDLLFSGPYADLLTFKGGMVNPVGDKALRGSRS